MKKYHRSYSTCAHVVQKTHDFIAPRVLLILTQNVYYRVIAVREGGPRPRDACRLFGHATTPPRMYEGPVRRSSSILPPHPKAPVPPNPVAFDHGIYPFDFARTGFDQWTSPPGCVRSAHRNTLEQHPGQTHSKIPSV